jgi:hypothetical protein
MLQNQWRCITCIYRLGFILCFTVGRVWKENCSMLCVGQGGQSGVRTMLNSALVRDAGWLLEKDIGRCITWCEKQYN